MKPLTPQELSIGNLLNYDTGEGIELTVIDWQDLKWLLNDCHNIDEERKSLLSTQINSTNEL